ncbi:unnamed protein product [Albugo candida]|uniref:CCHC-type domain-containing protein n=1 Tax=Albugo candida TaxID=65357 RepID=A0A024GR07_9STRA|nr:unnamed protein product [Albugo candida]|eukprot:CCI48793.1 unnamed protein product [Albugo candida]
MGSRTIRRGFDIYKRVILEHLVTVPDENVLNLLNPRIRGRPSGSTQRNLSQFDVVEASLRPQRRCGNCGRTGHNRRSCNQSRHNDDAACSAKAEIHLDALDTFDD